MKTICPTCNNLLAVSPGRNICRRCGAEIEVRPAELRQRIIHNAREEVELAIREFVQRFGDERPRTNQRG